MKELLESIKSAAPDGVSLAMNDTTSDFETIVRVAGFSDLLPKYEKSLRAAYESAQKIRAGLPSQTPPALEPAHVLRLEAEGQDDG
jgi:hypothetical protein